jgi:hypothetical protein
MRWAGFNEAANETTETAIRSQFTPWLGLGAGKLVRRHIAPLLFTAAISQERADLDADWYRNRETR